MGLLSTLRNMIIICVGYQSRNDMIRYGRTYLLWPRPLSLICGLRFSGIPVQNGTSQTLFSVQHAGSTSKLKLKWMNAYTHTTD